MKFIIFLFIGKCCGCRYNRILVDVVSGGNVLLSECIIWVVLFYKDFINSGLDEVFDYDIVILD